MNGTGTRRILAVVICAAAAALMMAGCSLDDGMGAATPELGSAGAGSPGALHWDSVLGRAFLPLPPGALVELNPVAGKAPGTAPGGTTPSATVFSRSLSLDGSVAGEPGESATLLPAALSLTLGIGESYEEHKSAAIPGAPPKGDVLFAIDLTGSMSEELQKVKSNSEDIMTAVRAVIPDTSFGVVSHMDYPGVYSGCGYGPLEYGTAARGDYPYRRDQSLTADTGAVRGAIGGLLLGYGADGPESYARVLYESYADPDIGWRDGAKRILLFWQDHIPHDCDPYLDGSQPTSGADPGRDAVTGTADDLILEEVLQGMADRNISLIALHSGSSSVVWQSGSDPKTLFEYWQKYAGITGGTAVRINQDGSVPAGAGTIAEFVAGLILAEVSTIGSITLRAWPPAYQEWLTSVTPAGDYREVDLSEPWAGDFDIVLTVPAGTSPGLHEFQIVLDGDGAVYASQSLSITVRESNQPPVADAGPDQTVEQTSPLGAQVVLDGSASHDPDGLPQALSYAWSWPTGSAAGIAPAVQLPAGSTEVTLQVSDGALIATDTVMITVTDRSPPQVELQVLAGTLWPPNHKLVRALIVSASDRATQDLALAIEVTHSEYPHDNQGVGDGSTEPDWQIDPDGSVWLRAERNGTGEGRIYTITVTATDQAGLVSSAVTAVIVPHDQGDGQED